MVYLTNDWLLAGATATLLSSGDPLFSHVVRESSEHAVQLVGHGRSGLLWRLGLLRLCVRVVLIQLEIHQVHKSKPTVTAVQFFVRNIPNAQNESKKFTAHN